MARVSRFTENIDLDHTTSREVKGQTTLPNEKTALVTSTPSVTKSNMKPTTKIFAGARRAARRLRTEYKCHFNQIFTRNLRTSNSHHDDTSMKAGSTSSSSDGVPTASAEELEHQAERNNPSAIFGIRLDDD